jgi:hypothetical protein
MNNEKREAYSSVDSRWATLLNAPKFIAHRLFFEITSIAHSYPHPKIVTLGNCPLLTSSWLHHWQHITITSAVMIAILRDEHDE